MKRPHLAMAGILAAAATAVTAQTVQQEIRVEKYAYQHGGMVAAPGSQTVMAGMIGGDGRMGLLNVPGKPFSATEVRRTVQMLANGAKIETSDSNQFYRDDQGRTRAEQTVDGRTTIVIMDPVARFVAILDRAAKTARKTPIPAEAVNGGISVADGKVMVRMGVTITSGTPPGRGGGPLQPLNPGELGEKLLNGVMAMGTRETRTIPVGAIGNDRELQMVDERWFSSDLQVMVKSVNSDPRFGETTYQLTNIVRAMQDPALFQIPPDYTVSGNFRLALPEIKPGK